MLRTVQVLLRIPNLNSIFLYFFISCVVSIILMILLSFGFIGFVLYFRHNRRSGLKVIFEYVTRYRSTLGDLIYLRVGFLLGNLII